MVWYKLGLYLPQPFITFSLPRTMIPLRRENSLRREHELPTGLNNTIRLAHLSQVPWIGKVIGGHAETCPRQGKPPSKRSRPQPVASIHPTEPRLEQP